MPAASSRPYQSRIFNFVHQQSRRVSEGLSSSIRHLQVAASWGVQIILYPIYLLFQSTESAGKRFYSFEQNWRQLPADEVDTQPQTPPATDQSIQRVLHLVNALPSEVPAANPSQKPPEPLSFLASLVSNALSHFKFLVFPPPHHPTSPSPHHPTTPSPHHPTTPPPHAVQGIATQLSTHTLVLVTAQNEILDILTPQQQQRLQQRIIAEVANYLCQLMSWIEQDESTAPASLQPAPDKALAFLDQTVAEFELAQGSRQSFLWRTLESHHLAPLSEVAIALARRSWQPVLAVATWLTHSCFSNTLVNGTQQPTVPPRTEHQFRIQALIWAAINYFFGDQGQSKLQQTAPNGLSDKNNSQFAIRNNAFGFAALAQLKRVNAHPLLGNEEKKNSFVSISSLKSDKLIPNSADSWLTLSDLFEQNTQINPAPDWIETYATTVGYVKHPLERLLQWLDCVMLWLEELLVRVVQWLQQQIAKKAI